MNTEIAAAVAQAIHVPTVTDSFVVCILKAKWPQASKNSPQAREAAVKDMLERARAAGRGLTREQAEKQVHANIQLFPDGELKAIKTPFYAFDTKMRRVCGKWAGTNQHLLSVHKIEYLEQEWQDTLLKTLPMIDKFCNEYSSILARLEKQGGYFDRNDYPSPETIRDKFHLEFTFQAIQDPSQFTVGGLSEQQLATLRQRLADSIQESAKEATERFARDLLGEVRDMQKSKRFHAESWLDKLTDYVESNLNVTRDPQLDVALASVREARDQVKAYVDCNPTNPDDRETLRQQVNQAAQEAEAKLAAFM